jgi:hypothetical protein
MKILSPRDRDGTSGGCGRESNSFIKTSSRKLPCSIERREPRCLKSQEVPPQMETVLPVYVELLPFHAPIHRSAAARNRLVSLRFSAKTGMLE